MIHLKAVLIKFPTRLVGGKMTDISQAEGWETAAGWEVPGTDGLMAIDMRHEADLELPPMMPAVWKITHIPTGLTTGALDSSSSTQAIARAQRFHDRAKALGTDMTSKAPTDITKLINALPADEKKEFFRFALHGEKPADGLTRAAGSESRTSHSQS